MSPKKPSKICCVLGCPNNSTNSPEVKLYAFPTRDYKKEVRERWISAVKRTNNPDGSPWQPKKHTRICSQHFIGNKKSEHPLSPSFIPTIFANKPKSDRRQRAAQARFERTLKRQATIGAMRALSTTDGNYSTAFSWEDRNESSQITDEAKHTKDQETQVNFLQEENDCKIFICNRYEQNNICHAEVQACFPVVETVRTTIKATLKKDTSCQTTKVLCNDQACGPGPVDFSVGFYGMASIKTDQEMLDLGGVTLANFQLLLKILPESKGRKISKGNGLLIFLLKMKLGITFSALRVLFNVHRSTISRKFFYILNYLSQACVNFVKWPSRDAIQATMPDVFKEAYKDCRVIIDCTEIKVEQPPTVQDRVHLYSHYKHDFTIKVLIGCTPSGVISFASKCFGGRTSDAQITTSSGLLNLLEPGDVVLADKGFPAIRTLLQNDGRGVLLVMPPFLHNGEFTEEEVQDTYKIASVRIHIERIIQRIKTYHILTKLPVRLLAHCDNIVFMSCVLANLQPPIIKESDNDNDNANENEQL